MKYRLKELRLERELTLQQLADKVGTNRSYLSNIENGHRKPSDPMLRDLAQALGVTELELIAGETAEESRAIEIMRIFMTLPDGDKDALRQIASSMSRATK